MKEAELERLHEGQNLKNKINECRGLLTMIKNPKGSIHITIENVYSNSEKIKLGDFFNKESVKAIVNMFENKMIELEKEFEEL